MPGVVGRQKGIGPFKLNLTELARSMPSLHQLLPEYACIQHGNQLHKTTETTLQIGQGHDDPQCLETPHCERGITWLDTGSTFSPSLAATCASTRGSTLANVPTAPEIAQVEISSRAVTSRARARWNSA